MIVLGQFFCPLTEYTYILVKSTKRNIFSSVTAFHAWIERLKNVVLIKRERNLLRRKFIESALIFESFMVNLPPGSYSISSFLTNNNKNKHGRKLNDIERVVFLDISDVRNLKFKI